MTSGSAITAMWTREAAPSVQLEVHVSLYLRAGAAADGAAVAEDLAECGDEVLHRVGARQETRGRARSRARLKLHPVCWVGPGGTA